MLIVFGEGICVRQVGRSRRKWEDNIKINLKYLVSGREVDWSGSGWGPMNTAMNIPVP
jgi:hypothetical protein